MKKLLISLYDRTGNWSKPYDEDPDWNVFKVDIQNGIDILTWDYVATYRNYIYNMSDIMPEVFIMAAQPCDAFALFGNRHKKKRLENGEFSQAMELVAKTKEIIDFFDSIGVLIGWVLENPMSDIHTHNKWLGSVRHKFNPCDYAGYVCTNSDIIMLNYLRGKDTLTKENYEFLAKTNAYNKMTWLWGNFKIPELKYIEPATKDSPIWKLYGGRSLKTKNARAITPLGFAKAFYNANN